jgi:uncharacterized membrane protein
MVRLTGACLAAFGAAITSYALSARWTDGSLACPTGGCETVQRSAYAEALGVPVAALGLVAFVCIGAAALSRAPWAPLVQAALALSGVLFSAYLLYVQLAVIGALCYWCLAADVTMTAMAALALLRLPNAPAPGAARSPAGRRAPYARRGRA